MRFAYKDKTCWARSGRGTTWKGRCGSSAQNGVVNDYELLGLTVTKPAPARHGARYLQRNRPRAVSSRGLEIGDAGPRLHHDQPGRQGGQALRSARQRGRSYVYLYAMSAARFLPADGQEVLPSWPRRLERISRPCQERSGLISLSFDPEHDTPELLRKHAQVRGATPPLWSYAVASHAELAKIAGAAGALLPARETTKSPTISARRSSIQRGNWPGSRLGTERNKWSDDRPLRRQSILCSPPRNSEPGVTISRSVDLCAIVL